MARGRLMWLTGLVLVLLFVGGIAGTYHFWPSNEDQRSAAFFSALQFIAVFALIWLTFLYVTATLQLVETTQQQLSDQNRPPKISVIQHYFPQADPFSVTFEIEIANPSVRATSVTIKSVQIGPHLAADSCFEINQARRSRATIPARELASVALQATFDSVPIELHAKQRTVLTFEDIFHGTLSPVIIDV
jgi:hypothetical protein